MYKGNVIEMTKDNIGLFQQILNDTIQVGDRVVKLEGSFGVAYSKVLIPRESTLDPVMLAEIDLRYHKLFEALVHL